MSPIRSALDLCNTDHDGQCVERPGALESKGQGGPLPLLGLTAPTPALDAPGVFSRARDWAAGLMAMNGSLMEAEGAARRLR